MSHTNGWDMKIARCNLKGPFACKVCGSHMLAVRGVVGPRSHAEAMAGKKRRHDLWKCKYATQEWHKQAKKLKQLAEDTPSPQLARIYNFDAEEVLSHKQTTKASWQGID